MLLGPAPLTEEEIRSVGFLQVGRSVTIDRTARFFGPDRIRLGDNARIDANTVLSAGEDGLSIGAYCHIAVGTTILGSGGVVLEDYCGISAHVSIFSSTEDYADGAMTNPTVPLEFRRVTRGRVIFRRHAIAGAATVVLPGVEIGLGASIGALTLVNKNVPDFFIVSGNPMRKIGERPRRLLEIEQAFERQRATERGSVTANIAEG